MNRTHKIRLEPTFKQSAYFRRVAGTARFVYNWALAEWKRQYEAGGKPNALGLKKQFNAIYHGEFPWISEVHRDCHSQPFADLGKAFTNFFAGRAKYPKFKKRASSRASFYVANDKLKFDDCRVRLPTIGKVKLSEQLRFAGKINSARVVEEGGHWFICVSVDAILPPVPQSVNPGSVVGVDLGVKTLATLSTGETVENPKPLWKALKRLRRAQRKLSRRVKGSNNRWKQARRVSRAHSRITNIRKDGLHKLTTNLCKNHATVVIEDLNVQGMLKNHRLAQAISDCAFSMFRQLLTYKAECYGTRVVVADRFFASSKTCSRCGSVKDDLTLADRTYCCGCGLELDRDLNAAINLKKLGAACPEVTPVDTPAGVVEAGTGPCSLVNTN